MASIILKSPAKLNLHLNVTGKRPDGYHNIQTVFERINLFDIVSITLKKDSDDIKIICNHPDVPTDERNLTYRSAKLLKKTFKIKQGLEIRIRKHIPIAAGLGGGSSNAACVLEGINKLLGLGITRRKLMQYGAKIGSDVPFFLSGASFAWAAGRGTKITPLNIKNKFWHILVVPKIYVSTKKIYQGLSKIWNNLTHSATLDIKRCQGSHSVSTLSVSHMEKTKNIKNKLQCLSSGYTNVLTKKQLSVKIITSALRKNDLSWIGRNCFNLLEQVALKRFKEIYELKSLLNRMGLKVVLMSGSGPSIFGIVSTRKEAIGLCRRLRKHHCYQVFVITTC